MSDKSLRELKRRWLKTSTVSDEAAYLSERVRIGDLEPEKLRILAYLSYPAATQLIDFNQIPNKGEELGIEIINWIYPIDRMIAGALVRIVIACARFALQIIEDTKPDNLKPRRTLVAAEKYLRCPCEDCKQQCEITAEITANSLDLEKFDDDEIPVYSAVRSLLDASKAIYSQDDFVSTWMLASRAAEQAFDALGTNSSAEDRTNRIKQHISVSLIPWLLGISDPILANPTPPKRPRNIGTD